MSTNLRQQIQTLPDLFNKLRELEEHNVQLLQQNLDLQQQLNQAETRHKYALDDEKYKYEQIR